MRLVYDQRCIGCNEWLYQGEDADLLADGNVRCPDCTRRFAEERDDDVMERWLEGEH